jgi:hypothetical protein
LGEKARSAGVSYRGELFRSIFPQESHKVAKY